MGITYFKRYRMEIDLSRPLFEPPLFPAGYEVVAWHESLLEAHAAVKFQSFCLEIDANVFPCLGEREGCARLMNEISHRDGFLPDATWLLVWRREFSRRAEYCGTVQGVRDAREFGAIQNLGITPRHRGLGLGSVLLHRALSGFRETGLRRAYLEVTAQNTGAIRLYQRLGFQNARTVYKAADVAYA